MPLFVKVPVEVLFTTKGALDGWSGVSFFCNLRLHRAFLPAFVGVLRACFLLNFTPVEMHSIHAVHCFHTTLPSSAQGNGLAQTPTQAEMTRGTTVQILFSRLQNALKAACDESGEQHRSSDVLMALDRPP